MSELIVEIRFARGWLKLYIIVCIFILLAAFGLVFMKGKETPPFFMLVVPVGVLLYVFFKRLNDRSAKLVFSENGIELVNSLKRFEFSKGVSMTRIGDKFFVPWTIILEAEFVNARGQTAVSLITSEDEAWSLSRGVFPLLHKSSGRKYVFDASNLEIEPRQIVSMI
ncbi:MAG TPA: hypothetical protein VFJ43_14810, partial [Bacteroidia bacterium]|nr:hypothetical protein [Bacteroidia bacterium]